MRDRQRLLEREREIEEEIELRMKSREIERADKCVCVRGER